MPLTDVWDEPRPIHASAQERLGYPTQKPVALLERIVTVEEALELRDRAVKLPLRRADTFKKAAREEDKTAQGKLDL